MENKEFREEVMQYITKLKRLTEKHFDIQEDIIEKSENIIRSIQQKKELNLGDIKELNTNKLVSMCIREPVLKYMGYVIITKELMDALAYYLKDKTVLEVMAGNGSLSKCLQDREVNIHPTDNELWATAEYSLYTTWQNKWTEVEPLDILEAVEKYSKIVDTIILSWPPYKSALPLQMIKMAKENNPDIEIIYVGENREGSTADDNFYEETVYVEIEEFKKVKDKFTSWKGFTDRIDIIDLK